MPDQTLSVASASALTQDPDGNLRVTRGEQSVGNRKGTKVVPMPGSVVSERYSAAEVTLYTETEDANARPVSGAAYATVVERDVYYEAFIGYGATVEVKVQGYVNYGGVLHVRVLDEDDNVVGAEQSISLTTYTALTFTWAEVANTVGDTLKIQARLDGVGATGALYVEHIKLKDPYARPVVAGSGSSVGATLSTALDTMGFPFVSYAIVAGAAGVADFEVSDDNASWRLHSRHTFTASGGTDVADVTTGFRYVRLTSDDTINWTFELSAKR